VDGEARRIGSEDGDERCEGRRRREGECRARVSARLRERELETPLELVSRLEGTSAVFGL